MQEDYREFLTRVAWMYYYGDMNQQQISEVLGLSRIKVTRLLKEANDAGIIEIKIKSENCSLYSLESRLKELSGLDYVVVVPSTVNLADSLCRGTAHLLNYVLKFDGSLGIGLTRTLKGVTKYIDKNKNNYSSIISISGSAAPNLAMTPLNIGFSISEVLAVDFYTIWAPAIVSVETDAGMLKRDKYISMVLDMAEKVSVSIVGLGSVYDSELLDIGYITAEEYKKITSSGSVGEICGNFFTADGERVQTDIEDRLISVDFPMACPVIGVAGGEEKILPIVGGIRSGLIQGLVCDDLTVKEVIKILEE